MENERFNLKKLVIIQVFGVFFKLARRVYYHLYFNLIKKTAIKTLIFLQKLIFEPKHCEVIENSSKAQLTF